MDLGNNTITTAFLNKQKSICLLDKFCLKRGILKSTGVAVSRDKNCRDFLERQLDDHDPVVLVEIHSPPPIIAVVIMD